MRSNIYPEKAYRKVFPEIEDEHIIIVKDAGHWVHFDKPLETTRIISAFLKGVDIMLDEDDNEE